MRSGSDAATQSAYAISVFTPFTHFEPLPGVGRHHGLRNHVGRRRRSGVYLHFGFSGDGFIWPASPTGLVDSDSFETPDLVIFYNDTGNNIFFDSQYQVIDDAAGFSEDALWGNPTDQYGNLHIYLYSGGPVDRLAFDFAWSAPTVPSPALQSVTIIVEDSTGRATSQSFPLQHAFTGFGGTDGYSGHIFIDFTTLTDTLAENDGGPFQDLAYVTVLLDNIVTGGPSGEFGIDNFELNALFGGGGELYPSVNNGQTDISNGGLQRMILGTGIFGLNFEVTNGGSATTYSTQLQPGGELIDLGQVNGVRSARARFSTPPTFWASTTLPVRRVCNDGCVDQ